MRLTWRFSFTHSFEDTQSAVAWLRDPANAGKVRSDSKIVVLIGHSMGGFMALEAGAIDPAIRAIVTISATDIGTSRLQAIPADKRDLAAKGERGARQCHRLDFHKPRSQAARRPLLIITSDDGLAAVNLPTDHSCSDHRIALQRTVLDELAHRTRK